MNTIIFDLDGLLIDSEVISYQLYQDLLKQYGYSFSVEDYAQNYSGKTGIGNMEALIERFQLPISMEEGLEFVATRENIYCEKGIALKPGVKEMLDYLKEHQCKAILATSSTKDRALGVLKQHEIAESFQEMVFGPEVERGKPSPDIFLKACEKAKESLENCLVLEDSEAGIQAAFSAHIPVICVPDMKRPGSNYEKMAQAVLPSLLEVIEYLKRLEGTV